MKVQGQVIEHHRLTVERICTLARLGCWLFDNNELCKSRNKKGACLLEFFITDRRQRLQDALYVLLPHFVLSCNFLNQL
jgi:hypothetical protein